MKGACEKIPTTFAYSVALLNLLLLPLSVCACIELYPLNATHAQPISIQEASVEAPYLRLCLPLLASKAILRSWSLVVIFKCALIVTGTTGLTGPYHLVPRTIHESTRAPYICTRI